MVTIEKIRKVGQPPEKLREEGPYGRLLRKASPYVTKFFIERNVSANQASCFSILLGIMGSFLFVFNNIYLMLISCVLYQFGRLFDQVDGEIARTTNTETIAGLFLEGITWHIAESSFFIFFGIGLYNTMENIIFVFCGFTFALFGWIVRNLRQTIELAKKKHRGKEDLYTPLIDKKSFTGRLYKRYYSIRMFFIVYRIGFLVILIFESLSPLKLGYTILGVPFNVLSTYFFLYGIDSSARAAYTCIKVYKSLWNLKAKKCN